MRSAIRKHRIEYNLSIYYHLLILSMLFYGCQGDCSNSVAIDQEYHAELYFENLKTKEPYLTEATKDSLRIYMEENHRLVPVYFGSYVDRRRKNAYIINAIRLIGQNKIELYIYFNQYDTDTLLFNNQISSSNKKCGIDHYLTTASYNGKFLKQVSSDTASTVSLSVSK